MNRSLQVSRPAHIILYEDKGVPLAGVLVHLW